MSEDAEPRPLPQSTSIRSNLSPLMDTTLGKALASLANECEAYSSAFYRRATGWRSIHYGLVAIGAIGPPVIGAVILLIPGSTTIPGIASILIGAVSAISNFSGAKDLATNQELAGDSFKKIGMDIQFDGLTSVTHDSRPEIKPYVDRVKEQIDKFEDPGLSIKHFAWVHDHLDVS